MNEIVLAFSLFISVIILFIIGGLYICSYTGEKRDFNDGVCKFCGSKLHYFDMDSGGARGYMCENCMKHWCWVSWKKIDKNYREDQK